MLNNYITINNTKTEIIILGSKKIISNINNFSLKIRSSQINMNDKVCNLGVVFDQNMLLDKYINVKKVIFNYLKSDKLGNI